MATLKSQGVVLKRGDGGSPTEVFTAIGELTAISGVGGGSASEIDVTSLASTAKEFILGLKDEGEVSLSLNLDTADTMQTGLRTDRDNNVARNFEMDLTDSGPTTISFTAFVKSYNLGVATDTQITLEVTLRLTGPATWA